MIRKELHTIRRDWLRWVLLIILAFFWFVMEALYIEIPGQYGRPIPNIDNLNLSYCTNYESVDEFMRHLSTLVMHKVPWDSSGVSWFLMAFVAVLLTRPFDNRTAQFALGRGTSRLRYLLVQLLQMAAFVVLLNAATLGMHFLRVNLYYRGTIEWPLFARTLLLRSLFNLATVNMVFLVDFAVQNVFLGVFLGYASFFLVHIVWMLLPSGAAQLAPMYYTSPGMTSRTIWEEPFNTALMQKGIIVSLVWIAVGFAATYLVFRKRDVTT